MVASQGVDAQQNADMYCGPVHSPYGDYYPDNHYYVHPDMCPAHVCAMQGEYGPVTVPMVSTNASPPIAMPVQVPPGHVVQQIVDESGTLRHVIISPQHPPNLLPLPTHNPQSYATGPGNSTNQSQQQQQYYAGLQSGYPPQQYHSNLQTGHQVLGAHPGHSPPPPPLNPPSSYYKDERTQRQHIKLKKKLHEKQQKNDGPPPSRKDHLLVNGLKRSPPAGGAKDKGMNSVGTSEDGEESSVPDEEDYHVYITDILSSVQPPKVSELTSRSALLQWAPPVRLSESSSNDDGHEVDILESDLRYEVLLSDKSKEMKFKSIYSGPSLSCRIRDLKPGQEYSVCLQVHLDELQSSAIDLQGSATDPFKFVTPPCEPDQPQPPKLVNRTKNSLQLKWTAGVDNGSPIVHYVLEYDGGKGEDFVEFYRGRSKTHTLQKLQPATLYTFRLAAVNDYGTSLYSDNVAFNTTEMVPTQPNPPTLVEAGVQSLHLQWLKRPRDDEFVLQMNDEQNKYGFINVHLGPEDRYVRKGLQHSSNYSFRLRAKNDGGLSPWSDEVSFCTLPDRPSRPSKPVVKGRIHAHSFKLKWDPPHDTGGVDILRYILEVNSGSGYEVVYQGKETEAVCDKLTPGTTYQLRVCCVSVGGCSNPSDPCTVTTDAVCPGQCSLPKLVGKPLPHSVSLRWVEPDYNGGAPILDYEVEMTSGATQSIVYKSKENECTVNNLSPGCDYVFRVRAVNRVGPGQWSDALKVTSGAAPPDAPAIPTVQYKSAFQVYVEWFEPPSNGAAVSEYRLEMSPDVNEEKFLSVYQGPQLNYDVKGLTPFRSYYFRVQAGNSAGFSGFSPVAGTITPAAPPMVVTTLKAEATPSSITLRWSHPSDNGSPITHYNIELGDRTFSTESAVDEYTIDDLQPATNYKIKIQAVNIVGQGPYSTSLRTATPRLPPAAPRLECIAIGHNHLKLKWGEGKNTEYTQYCIEMENPRSKDYQCVYKGTALTCKVNRLDELSTYKFRINAKNDAGTGDFSQAYEFTTCIAPPAALRIPKVTELEQRSCTITWFPVRHPFTDRVTYQVQLARLKEQVFKQVCESSEIKCTIENLEPGTDYTAKVCTIRITSTGMLPGPYSPPVNFTTLSSEPDQLAKTTTMSSAPAHTPKHRSLYHSIRQMVRCPEEYCIYMYALLVLILGIVISLGITSFL